MVAVIVIRNVFFEGLIGGHKSRVAPAETEAKKYSSETSQDYDLVKVTVPSDYLEKNKTCLNWADFAGEEKKGDYKTTQEQLTRLGILEKKDSKYYVKKSGPDDGPGFPSRVYRGTTYKKGSEEVMQVNTGHMGNLDHCRSVPRLYGAGSFVYDSNPNPRSTAPRV